ncbi:MAG: RsmE family RNA methyltransferase [Kofleriaceae bacterium]
MAPPLVVVTGGAGFIGSHTVDRLLDGGARVVVLDDLSTGSRRNLARWAGDDRLELVVVDVSHGIFAALEPVTRRHGPVERIVHLAAQVSVVHSVANPLTDLQINYGGTLHVLEYARATGVRKVTLASSAAVYGDVAAFPVREDAPRRPLSPYGIHKHASEQALQYYSVVHGVPTTALRFFNVYGPRQDPSSPYSGVISIFADRARSGRGLTIFGDGSQTRDFVYVGDVARAICAATLSDGVDGAVFNVGTGRELTVRALAEQVVATCGGGATITHAPARAGEIARSVADVAAARQALGFVAETEFADGLRATLASAGVGVNRLLVDAHELVDGRVEVGGRRADHLLEVLRVQPGRTLKAGVLDGPRALARVTSIGPRQVFVELEVEAAPPPPSALAAVTVWLAVPRPKVLARVLQTAAALGVGRVDLTNAWRVDKGYFGSPRLSPSAIRHELVVGAEQGGGTRLPTVEVHPRLMGLVERGLGDATVALLAEPSATTSIEEVVAPGGAGPVVLAIGPEGGWIEREVLTLRELGLRLVGLGVPTLRTEAAVVAALAQLALLARLPRR